MMVLKGGHVQNVTGGFAVWTHTSESALPAVWYLGGHMLTHGTRAMAPRDNHPNSHGCGQPRTASPHLDTESTAPIWEFQQ